MWIKLHGHNEPDKEVLAANFAPDTYGYKEKLIGYIYWDKVGEFYACETDGVILENCTHFIDLDSLQEPV